MRVKEKNDKPLSYMIERKLLLGDEAVALGAIHAGISGVYAYPGTPSTEITEYIQTHAPEIRSRWCTNEKTALEAALGMSYAGKRALVCMKHVGMNVAADAFINSAITGVNGGIVVLAADDPSMHSSQNEQDSRFYGKFAMIPILEPSTQQEAYDIMPYAFCLSEELKLPVLLRVVTRLAHSRAGVAVGRIQPQNPLHLDNERTHWVLLPGNARRQYASLIEKQPLLLASSEKSPYNKSVFGEEKSELGIIACGITADLVRLSCGIENYQEATSYHRCISRSIPPECSRRIIRKVASRTPRLGDARARNRRRFRCKLVAFPLYR